MARSMVRRQRRLTSTSRSARGYAETVGALLLSVFASAGALAMIITSHTRRMYDVALASAAGGR